MKTIINSLKRTHWFKVSMAFLTCLLLLTFSSCQKEDSSLLNQESLTGLTTTAISTTSGILYYGHKTFTRSTAAPFVEILKLENPNFDCFDGNFVLKIQNGSGKRTRVLSAEIRIDGVLVVGLSDFLKDVSFITKPLSGLTPESILEVKLNSAPGSFIDLWIEGTITIINTMFEQIGPLCQNSTAPELPLGSTNIPAITGTWDPVTISTAIAGTTKYTFTPAEGQCGTTVTMDIEVATPITPIFTEIGPVLQNSTPPGLPTTSTNGITGTWIPEDINTTTVGTLPFTFTPDAGQCATTATMNISCIPGEPVPPAVGDSYQGGIVYYILQPIDPGYVDGETHGLIAATSDQAYGIIWYNGVYSLIGTGDGIGTGAINTRKIVEVQISDNPEGNFAAKVCMDYSVTDDDGVIYDDWFLPSKNELMLLYYQRNIVPGFTYFQYWSSTEYDNIHAYTVGFYDHGGQGGAYKAGGAMVRAVRSF